MDRAASGRLNSSRPTTAMRPMTGASTARPRTTTGLQAPRTSRGKSAGMRRQIQDKTYWMNVLKAKMTELTNEISNLNADNTRMASEQSRFSGLKKQAEQVAKELSALTHELSIYNEYVDRSRMGDTAETVKEDIEALKSDNEEIQTRLDDFYQERKELQSTIARLETDLTRRKNVIDDIKRKITNDEGIETLSRLEAENVRWTKEVKKLESEIRKQLDKKREIEYRLTNDSGESSKKDSFLRREIITAIDTINGLERQKEDLVRESSAKSSTMDEKGRLLGQIKRDNRQVNQLEDRIRELKMEISDMTSELESYEDTDTIAKMKDLKKKETSMDAFLSDYEEQKRKEIEKIQDVGASSSLLLDKITRMISHVDGLKASSMSPTSTSKGGSGVDRLHDEKRKLELDLNKIQQLEVKIKSEVESLKTKIDSLEEDISIYSDLDKLKSDISEKSQTLQDDKERLMTKLANLKTSHDDITRSLREIKETMSSSKTYEKLKTFQHELSELISANERLRISISEMDHSSLREKVLSDVKEYNQRLQGY